MLFFNISGNIFLFLNDRPWILPWMKSISNRLDITNHVIASQLSGYCDVINTRLWRHQENVNLAREPRGRCVKTVVLIVILSSLCHVRNKIMLVLSWWTVSALTRVSVNIVFISIVATLSWALKQCVTRVHRPTWILCQGIAQLCYMNFPT